MVTEMITLKLDDAFLKEIDSFVANGNYQNRTEFIRSTLREKIEDAKLKQAMLALAQLKGAGKKSVQTTDEELEQVREQVMLEFGKKFRRYPQA